MYRPRCVPRLWGVHSISVYIGSGAHMGLGVCTGLCIFIGLSVCMGLCVCVCVHGSVFAQVWSVFAQVYECIEICVCSGLCVCTGWCVPRSGVCVQVWLCEQI